MPREGTTKQLVQFVEEEGWSTFQAWYYRKMAVLEELNEAGFHEVCDAIPALYNSYMWVKSMTKEKED